MPDQAQYAALEQRVVGIEDAVKGLGTAIGNLANKLEQKSTTQWPVIWSAAGTVIAMLGLVGTIAYLPMLGRMQTIETNLVPRAEHVRSWELHDKTIDRLLRRIDRMDDAFDADLRGRARPKP